MSGMFWVLFSRAQAPGYPWLCLACLIQLTCGALNAQVAAQSGASRYLSNRSARSLELPENEANFSFAVLGDRTGGPSEGVQILAQAVDEINLLDPDLVMTVGDMIQGYNGQVGWLMQMREYRHIMEGLHMPWFPVAGNHDIYWRGQGMPPGEHESNYEQHFGPLWYAFEHKGAWFIILYSDEGNPQTGEKATNKALSQQMSQRQFDWLADTLGQCSKASHVFVFLHHPRWLGGQYGDDWEKVHRLLVGAGNVKAVFAGHIHRMRYDGIRDGIEYVTLATTGGSQNGRSPDAGYLHQFHMVSVRGDRLSMAALPVGRTMDVRQVTGKISQDMQTLDGVVPGFSPRFEMASDGGADGLVRMRLQNPLDIPIKVRLNLESLDSRWIFSPSRFDRTIPEHEEMECHFRLFRWSDSLDLSWKPPLCKMLLQWVDESDHVFDLLPKSFEIPYRVDLPAPAVPSRESVMLLDGRDDCMVIAEDQLQLTGDSLTLEMKLFSQKPSQDAWLISNQKGQAGLTLGLEGGIPFLSLYDVSGQNQRLHAPVSMAVPDGRWCHLVAQIQPSGVAFLLDGQRHATLDYQGSIAWQGGDWVIGASEDFREGGNHFFAGRVDGIRLSNSERYPSLTYPTHKRHLPDRDTRLLLNMDDIRVHWLYDESRSMAHPVVHGDAILVAEP